MNTSVLLLILGLVARGFSLSCAPPPIRCGAPPFGCSYGVVTGVCGCDECAMGPGDECGGPFRGDNCGDGLECQEPSPFDSFNANQPGVCVYRVPSGGNRGSSVEWSPLVNACIRGHNNRIEDDVLSIADCKNRCQNERSFTCRSVELNDKRCVLSDANSDFFEYQQPCLQPNHGSGWIYSEIKVNNCPRGPSYSDGCNTCTCNGNGGYSCTERFCSGPAEFSIGHQRFAVLADKKGLDWWKARIACQNLGYELAQPDDLRSLAQYVARNYGLTNYWLGGYSTHTNPEWLNGRSIEYNRFLWRTQYTASRGHCLYIKDANTPPLPGILGLWQCGARQYMAPLCEVPASGFPHPPPAAAAPVPAAAFAPAPAFEGASSIPE